MRSIEEYQTLVELVVLGRCGLIASDDSFHDFEWGTDGDGWNEPESDWCNCSCGWDGPGWVQIDPARTGRPTISDLAFEWMDHINNDVWKADDDGNFPED